MADFFSGIVQQILAALAAPALLAIGALLLVRWRRKSMSRPPKDRIVVMLARLDGDSGNVVREVLQECIERELKGNVAVLRWDESLTHNAGYHDSAEVQLLDTAHQWLNRSGADVLVWGRLKSSNVLSLRFVAAKQKNTPPQTYILTPDTLDLPTDFITHLGAAIGSYAAATVRNEIDKNNSVAPTLELLRNKLKGLLKSRNEPLDDETLATLNQTAARASARLYDLLGNEEDLREAIVLGRKALSLRAQATSPDKWAADQNNLGTYLARLGERTGVVSYFDEAISALIVAIEVKSESKSLLSYAATKMNLGNVFLARGQREAGDASLREAARIFDELATQKLRDLNPQFYAALQSNRGNLFASLAEREGSGLDSLNKSLAAFTEALEIRTKEASPFDWAIAKVNHCNALITFGERTGEVALYQGAIHEAKDALQIIKRLRNPRIWSMAHANLGSAQLVVGIAAKDEGMLKEAISNLKNSCQNIGRDSDPILWLKIQHNLGRAYTFLGEMLGDVEFSRAAMAPFKEALDHLSNRSDRRDKCLLLNEYGLALAKLGTFYPEHLEKAEAVFRELLLELNQKSMPLEWGRAMLNLGNIQRDIGVETSDVEKVQRSVATLKECLASKTLEENRGSCALLNFSIAKSFFAEAAIEIDQNRQLRDQLDQCREHCHNALKFLEAEPGNDLVNEIGKFFEDVEELEAATKKQLLEGSLRTQISH